MKKMGYLLLLLLFLTGCAVSGQGAPKSTAAATEAQEASLPWVHEDASPWDREGVLQRVSLEISDGLHYVSAQELCGNLLLWSMDNHLETQCSVDLCVLDLSTGEVTARKIIEATGYPSLQILENRICLLDAESGNILILDERLDQVGTWKAEPRQGNWYLGGEDVLYIYNWEGGFDAVDLKTGETTAVLGDAVISDVTVHRQMASIRYYDAATGEDKLCLLNLGTGELWHSPMCTRWMSAHYREGIWLYEEFDEGYTWYLGPDADNMQQAELGYSTLELLSDGNLLLMEEERGKLSVCDRTGKSLGQCTLTEVPYSHSCCCVIPSADFGGYFLVVSDYSGSIRLLYWDLSRSGPGEDIPFSPVPTPTEQEQLLRERIDALQTQYGVLVFTGENAQTLFYDFTSEPVIDYDEIEQALDILEQTLEVYPEGFFRQLRYDTIQNIQIHMVGTLNALDPAVYADSYVAFVQEEYDSFVLGVDILSANEETYYHEFSHMIDAFLEWDAGNREDALFSEDTWSSLNPAWFPGYTYDYSWEQELQDYTSFVDSYSTIRPTEDRARVLEYAMSEYGYSTFEGSAVLREKLAYYCRCIRDAFDTASWPDDLPWEQYLK